MDNALLLISRQRQRPPRDTDTSRQSVAKT